jgi:hypothetical protein
MKISTYTYKQCLSSDSTQWCTVKLRIKFLCPTWGHVVRVDVYFLSLLAVAWDGGECLASCPGRLTHCERTPDTHCIGDWVDCGVSLDILEKKKIFDLCQELNPSLCSLSLASVLTTLFFPSSSHLFSERWDFLRGGLGFCKCCLLHTNTPPLQKKPNIVCLFIVGCDTMWSCVR